MAAQFQTFNRSGITRILCACAIGAVALHSASAAQSPTEFVGPQVDLMAEPPTAMTGGDPAVSNLPVDLAAVESRESLPIAPSGNSAPEPRPAPAIESQLLGRSTRSGIAGADRDASQSGASSQAAGNRSWFLETTAALALVIGLIMALKWGGTRLARRSGGIAWHLGPAGRAPSGVLEVLGRFPVSRGHSLVLLKMDRRVLLLGQSSSGFTVLSQVTDPEDVASLIIKTRDDEGASMAARFNELLHEMERDPTVAEPEPEIHQGEPATGPRLPRIGLRGVSA